MIVGLGNPGSRYARTRHNAGFMALDELARRHGLRFSGKQANAEIARGSIEGQAVILAKPQTYMNNSGQAVGALARYYRVPLERLLVVYDEIALPLGTIRIREKGSPAGHNGLTSVIRHLRTQNFPRLRIGIGRPITTGYSQIDWVLGRFASDEQEVVKKTLPKVADAIEAVLRMGIERAMNIYNTQDEDGEQKAVDSGQWAESPAKPEIQNPTGPKSKIQNIQELREKIGRIMHREDRKG